MQEELLYVNVDPDLQHLFDDYLAKRIAEFSKVEQFIENNDYKAIEFMGHKFAGNAGLFNLDFLGNMAQLIEKAAKEENPQRIRELSLEVLNHLKKVRLAE